MSSKEKGDSGSNIPLASAYRLLGANFVKSAKILSQSLETKANGSPANLSAIPFYFLASHAAELFLKSALLKRGVNEGELKKFDLRHNLKALAEALRGKGVSITPESVWLIEGLHRQHQTYALRYSVFVDDGERSFVPPFGPVFTMLEELLLLTRISTQGV